MLSDEEKKELQELINLLYNGHISQYGKRKLEAYIKKQQTEIEELKEGYKIQEHNYQVAMEEIEQRWEDKIKAKIEEEDELFFKTKDVRHANRYKAYKELIKEE